MVNGVNGVSASKPATKILNARKAEPLDLSTVERKHIYKDGTQGRLFGLRTAPTYRPTHTEFSDPLKYIEQISPHAKKFGICKIIPPDDWQPDFALDTKIFNFRTRKQELNSMEAKCRASLNYIDQLFKFHTQNGTPMRGLPTLEGKPMNLYQLKEVIERHGGYSAMNQSAKSSTTQNMWNEVGKDFGFADNPSLCESLSVNFKSAYQRYVLPYESFLYRERPKIASNPVLGTPPKMTGYEPSSSPDLTLHGKQENADKNEELTISPPSQASSLINTRPKRQTRQEKESNSRALKRQKRSSTGTPNPSPKKVAMSEATPGENCETCGRGDDGKHMLLCDGCEAGYHIYCLDPPLVAVPKIDWYCSRCLVGTGEFGFEEGGTYSLLEFQKKANKWKDNYFRTQNDKVDDREISSVTESDVEKEFWRLVQDVNDTVEIEYGADVHSSTHGSAFPTLERNPRDIYAASPWNLNNMPLLNDSLLRFIKTDISGMTVPWLYVGMCFSTFCWHNEDHYTYSINYQHFGETKTWYGIPGNDAIKFEDVMKRAVPELFEQQPDLLLQLVTIFSPERLVAEGVEVFACDQHAREFVITFPQAYHAGFNHGFNFNEAVNFALPDWVADGYSKDCVERYRTFARQPVFSHDELLLTAAHHDPSIETSIWLTQALEEMVVREVTERSNFKGSNPQITEQLVEHDVPEEEYMCGKCKVLSYLTQVTCSCTTKVTCLEHSEELCECDINSRKLRLRYTDDYLQRLQQRVRDKARLPDLWREKFFATINEGPTPHIKTLRSLLAEGDRIPYPLEELPTLRSFVARVNSWIERATPLLSKKGINIGRRKSEKFKKSSRLLEAEEQAQELLRVQRQPGFAEQLVAEARSLAFDSYEIQALQEKSLAIKRWKEEAGALMLMNEISIDRCLEIIESGQALNVELPEVQQFVTYVTQLKWLEEARPSFAKTIPLEDVIRMWDAGKACGVPVEALEMHKLDQRRQAGVIWEEQVTKVLSAEKVSLNSISHAMDQAKSVCVSAITLSKLQVLMEKAQHMQKEIASFTIRTRDPEYGSRPTVHDYQLLQDKVDLLRVKPQEVDQLIGFNKALNEWIRRGKRIFGKTNAPLDIFGLHLDHVAERNSACLSLDDIPRDPVEPASREATPDPSQDQIRGEPRSEIFCMCRRPEAGLMLECDICHEWYHGKCLKIAKKDLKSTNNYVCPICDWREEIPRAANRPKLEEMQALERDGRSLPLRTTEVPKLELITNVAVRFKERVMPLLSSYLTLTSAELPTLKFYLRKLEGAEILLAAETNFFRAKIHELNPIAPSPPPQIEESKSTKRPRLSKKRREELEALGIDPNSIQARAYQRNGHMKRETSQESRSRSNSPIAGQAPEHVTRLDLHSSAGQAQNQSQSFFSNGTNPYDASPAQFGPRPQATPNNPESTYQQQDLSPHPQYQNVDSSQYQSSASTPAAYSSYLPEAFTTAHPEFNPTNIDHPGLQDIQRNGNLFSHLSAQGLSSTDMINSAMKLHGDPAHREPDDASYLLDFANQSGDFTALNAINPSSQNDNTEDSDMMDSFLNP